MVNGNKIKGRIVELGKTQYEVASLMGISQPTLSQKISNQRPMYLQEIELLAKCLELSKQDILDYFFCD